MRDPLFDPLLSGLHSVLDLRQKQHSLIASNIANVDTPGFKAHFVDLEEALPKTMDYTDRHIRSGSDKLNLDRGPMAPDVEEIEAPPWSLDGNSVDLGAQMGRLSSNALMYQGVARGLGRKMALLKFAATNGRG